MTIHRKRAFKNIYFLSFIVNLICNHYLISSTCCFSILSVMINSKSTVVMQKLLLLSLVTCPQNPSHLKLQTLHNPFFAPHTPLPSSRKTLSREREPLTLNISRDKRKKQFFIEINLFHQHNYIIIIRLHTTICRELFVCSCIRLPQSSSLTPLTQPASTITQIYYIFSSFSTTRAPFLKLNSAN